MISKKINIAGDDVDGDAIFFNWMSLKEKGIPKNSLFAARFMSNVPVVISNKYNQPTHKSINI